MIWRCFLIETNQPIAKWNLFKGVHCIANTKSKTISHSSWWLQSPSFLTELLVYIQAVRGSHRKVHPQISRSFGVMIVCVQYINQNFPPVCWIPLFFDSFDSVTCLRVCIRHAMQKTLTWQIPASFWKQIYFKNFLSTSRSLSLFALHT